MSELDRAIDRVERERAVAGSGGEGVGDIGAEERAAFLARYPFERFWDELLTREQRQADRATERGLWARLVDAVRQAFTGPRIATAVGAVAVVAIAAVGGVWLARGELAPSEDALSSAPSGLRFKGGPASTSEATHLSSDPVDIEFYVRNGDSAVRGVPGEAYGEGDQFRFTYWSGDNDFLVLLSVEESGKISVLYPDPDAGEDASRSVRILRGRNIPLEGSVLLNDYVGKERFFALFSSTPLSTGQVREAASEAVETLLQRDGNLEGLERLPIDVPQDSFWIEKR